MIKNWHIVASAIVAALAILAVLGFNSPASAVSEMRVDIKVVQKRIYSHDVQLAEIRKDLGYIADGIDDLREKKRRDR